MPLTAIRENKIFAKLSYFTVQRGDIIHSVYNAAFHQVYFFQKTIFGESMQFKICDPSIYTM